MSLVPLPRMDAGQSEAVAELVPPIRRHLAAAIDHAGRLRRERWEAIAKGMLLAVDAAVLRAYNLPPRLERALLDEFRGEQRRVPFPFTEYHDRDFTPNLPLWMVISPEYAKCNADFLRQTLPKISDPELTAALENVG